MIRKNQPVTQPYATHRHERITTGISARGQRRRRVNRVFLAEFGTRRGLRKYYSVLNRSFIRTRESRWHKPHRPYTRNKPANRAEQRWLERYWDAQAEVV